MECNDENRTEIKLKSSDSTNSPETATQSEHLEDRSQAGETDSGVSSDPSYVSVNNALSGNLQIKEIKTPAVYLTSTPKKVIKISDAQCNILQSQATLDDPHVSSIAGDLTEVQADNLSSEEESNDHYSQLYETKIKADHSSTLKTPITKPVKSRVSPRQNFEASCVDPSSIKKNLFDIPVSPKLKNKVRERLYTLVNSIDGYEGKVKFADEEELGNLKDGKALSGVRLCWQCKQVPESDKRKPCIHVDTSINTNTESRVCKCQAQESESSRLTHPCSLHNQEPLTNMQQCSLHNLSSLSTFSNSTSGYGAAMSSILTAQMRSLQLHEQQITQERITLALRKKDQEMNTQASAYQEKIELMVQIVGRLEGEVKQLQQNLKQQKQIHAQEIQQLQDMQEKQIHTIRVEAERKVKETDDRATFHHQESLALCNRQISEIMKATQERMTAVEGEHQAHTQQLTSIITKLRANNKELEGALGCVTSPSHLKNKKFRTNDGKTERDHFAQDESPLHTQLDPVESTSRMPDSIYDTTTTQQSRITNRTETEVVMLQKKLNDLEEKHKQLLSEAVQEAEKKGKDEVERVKTEVRHNLESHNTTVSLLQQKLSLSLSQNLEMQQNLNERDKRERDMAQRLAVMEDRQTELAEYRITLAKERETAIRQETREEIKKVLDEMGTKYKDLLVGIQNHYRAQIEEYREAVRVLKRRIKKIEEK